MTSKPFIAQKYYFYIVLLPLFFFISSCNLNKNNKVLDLSDSKVEVNIARFEKKFIAIDTNTLIRSLKTLRAEDSVFFDTYTIPMMRFGPITDTVSPSILYFKEFFTNKDVRALHDSVSLVFNDLNNIETELAEAFKYFQHYFPKKKLPKVVSVVSEFSYNAVTFDSTYLVFSLDMYLGKDFTFYQSIDLPAYKTQRFSKEYMVPNGMEVLYQEYFVKEDILKTRPLIYEMIEKGKKLYFLECMMPLKEKHILIGYTPEQLKWCESAEADIWAFYNEEDLFYSKNYMEHKKHVDDGPKTAGMPKEAPGNVGSWLGWQIVNQYMKNSGDAVSLSQLINTSPETIMNKSKYKPNN